MNREYGMLVALLGAIVFAIALPLIHGSSGGAVAFLGGWLIGHGLTHCGVKLP